jgi:sulfatase modifying factor 1
MVGARGLAHRARTLCALLTTSLVAACFPTFDVGPADVKDAESTDVGSKDTDSRDSSSKDSGTRSDATMDSGEDSGGDGVPPSCAPGGAGMTNCGPGGTGSESCCTSLAVTGGTFDRSYDDVTYTDKGYPAKVSTFRLDKYEITVGRFRQFVNAGWLPPKGSGKHRYLNKGKGLDATGGGYETGWDANTMDASATDWNSYLQTTPSGWTNSFGMCGGSATWTASPGSNELMPVNCITWYAAYAFCIWDGGFLPSEAEWNYAAAGGGGSSGQRVYSWSEPSTSTTIDCGYANYDEGLCPTLPFNVGTDSPLGDGAFGQTDLAGNVVEYTLDYGDEVIGEAGTLEILPYINPCTDCANLTPANRDRMIRGGSFQDDSTPLLSSYRLYTHPEDSKDTIGARCARAP